MPTRQLVMPAEILEFYRELTDLQKEFVKAPKLKVSRSQKDNHLTQKAPMMSFVVNEIDESTVKEALNGVCRVITRHRPHLIEVVENLQEKLLASNISELMDCFIWQDHTFLTKFTADKELDEKLFFFVLFNTAKPFVESYAKGLAGQLPVELWKHNCCPVCGWKPVLSITTADGDGEKRLLHCSFCETKWPFKRMECPHCLNEDHSSLGYFNVENEEAYRVHVCEKCKGYIKSVEEKELLVKQDSLMTDVQTLHLDLLAEHEGYHKDVVVPGNGQAN